MKRFVWSVVCGLWSVVYGEWASGQRALEVAAARAWLAAAAVVVVVVVAADVGQGRDKSESADVRCEMRYAVRCGAVRWSFDKTAMELEVG